MNDIIKVLLALAAAGIAASILYKGSGSSSSKDTPQGDEPQDDKPQDSGSGQIAPDEPLKNTLQDRGQKEAPSDESLGKSPQDKGKSGEVLPTLVSGESPEGDSGHGDGRGEDEPERPEPKPSEEVVQGSDSPDEVGDNDKSPNSGQGSSDTDQKKPYPGRRPLPEHEKEKCGEKRHNEKNRKPDIICREINRKWEMIIDAENNDEIQSVVQNGEHLDKERGVYKIREVKDLEVIYENEETRKIELNEDRPLIFMAQKNWQGKARKVKKISSKYHYVVLAPECCGGRKGKPPIAKEHSVYPGYNAHFFAPNENAKEDGFENCSDIMISHDRFSLDGDAIVDNHDAGDIFSTLPALSDVDGFKDVSEIHVGHEGQSNGWRESYEPKKKSLPDLLQGKGGWFFIRVHDTDELIHSIDFRLLPGFSGIKIHRTDDWQKNPIVPDTIQGHSGAHLEFIGEGIKARPKNEKFPNSDSNKLVYQIPPEQQYDKTNWEIENGEGQKIEARVILPRIWWRRYIGDEKHNWISTPIEMERQDICDASPGSGGIEIAIPYFMGKFKIGLGTGVGDNPMEKKAVFSEDRSYRSCRIGLSEFRDHRIVENPIAEDISLYICLDDKTIPIIKIPADAPSVCPKFPACSVGAPRTSKGKIAKGFSRKEIKESGICRPTSVRIDKRRKSCHNHNIHTLRKHHNAQQK